MPLAGHYPAPSPHLAPGPFTSWRSLAPSLSPSGSQENPSQNPARRPERRRRCHCRRPSPVHAELSLPPLLDPNRLARELPHLPLVLDDPTSTAQSRRSAAAATSARRPPLLTVAGAPQAASAHTETTYGFPLSPWC